MNQEFNKVTTTSNFIKNLLISTYLPLIRTVRDFDYIINDSLYVYKCEIIKCTKSGYLVTGHKNIKFNKERASYRVLSEYHFGERNDKLCTNYISNSEGYDSTTHERLGKYLRSLRDMYDLNLMPLYNCFSNQVLQAHHIFNDRVEKTAADYNTKIYKVPIRFNTDYTICMDNLGVTTFAPAFIKNNNLILLNNTRFGNNVDATNKYIKLYRTNVIQHKANSRFKAPYVIRYNNVPETRKVSYAKKTNTELDFLHNDLYYQLYDSSMLPRVMYYIKNTYDYIIVENLTSEEFLKNPTKYYYSNNGFITQCSDLDNFNTNLIYFVLNNSSTKSTYLPTSLTPETAGSTILYVGIEPSTGRMDSTYVIDSTFRLVNQTVYSNIPFWIENNAELHFVEDQIDASLEDRTIFIDKINVRIYDSPNYKTISLYDQCNKYSTYDDTIEYYIRDGGEFKLWNYQLTEDEFNSNKTSYFIKDNENNYIQCTEESEYDPTETYYVSYRNSYITTKEYAFILDINSFYIPLGFQDDPTKYYKLEEGKFIQVQAVEEFDMNTTYAVVVDKKLFTWKELNSNNELVDSEDTYIITGKKYYAKYVVEEEEQYVYDITEENCALYDYLENNLYLLIQVPKSLDTSIVILEGNYLNTQSEKIADDSDLEMMPSALMDYLYTSSLKLMQMPYSKPIPFSNVLIEFLLWNAICGLDSINNDMDRLLASMRKIYGSPLNTRYRTNYWYAQYRKLVSDVGKYYNNKLVTDNLGYVTKNLEQVIETSPGIKAYLYEDVNER